MVKNVTYFHSTMNHGNMNCTASFYPNEMSQAEIRMNFDQRRYLLGKEMGFNGYRILTAIQKKRPVFTGKTEEEQEKLMREYLGKYPDGHYVMVTMDMVRMYPDLYDLDIEADILMMNPSTPDIVLAQPVADCPVVFVEDTKSHVVAMGHCGGEYIDRGLPGQIVDAVCHETGCKMEDVRAYVGPHIHVDDFTYDCYPPFALHSDRWKNSIRTINGTIHIDLKNAVLMQLLERGVSLFHITCSTKNTAHDNLYSHSSSRFDESKSGRFYTGCFYGQETNKILMK